MIQHLNIRPWASRSELEEHFRSRANRHLWVGGDAEAPSRFFSVELPCKIQKMGIGIISSGLGVKPSVINLDEPGLIVIGHDAAVTGIDTRRFELLFTESLIGCFYEFVAAFPDNIVLVHEIGVVAIGLRGHKKWSIDTEVIKEFSVEGNGRLILRQMETVAPVVIDMAAGLIIGGDERSQGSPV